MKRSRRIALTLMAGSAIGLAACDDSSEVRSGDVVYKTVSECATGGVFTAEHCEASFAAAQKAHAETAPKFTSQASCEEQFGAGACQPQASPDGGSWFMPFVMGYAVSSALDDLDSVGKRRSYRAAPLYGGSGGTYITRSGHSIKTASVSTSGGSGGQRYGTVTQTRTAVVSHGGFSGGGGFGG